MILTPTCFLHLSSPLIKCVFLSHMSSLHFLNQMLLCFPLSLAWTFKVSSCFHNNYSSSKPHWKDDFLWELLSHYSLNAPFTLWSKRFQNIQYMLLCHILQVNNSTLKFFWQHWSASQISIACKFPSFLSLFNKRKELECVNFL